eukprot:6209353-Pleurochrysis_carterae.AAC.2
MPFEAILHAQRSAEVPVIARDAGQAIFQCPSPVPARAATSRLCRSMCMKLERMVNAYSCSAAVKCIITKAVSASNCMTAYTSMAVVNDRKWQFPNPTVLNRCVTFRTSTLDNCQLVNTTSKESSSKAPSIE